MNHHYELVFETSRGTVHKRCDKPWFEVNFGNLLVPFTYKNLVAFKQFVEAADNKKLESMKVAPSNKIPIHNKNFAGSYAFDEEEFLEFRELLCGAVAMLSIENEVTTILTQKIWKK